MKLRQEDIQANFSKQDKLDVVVSHYKKVGRARGLVLCGVSVDGKLLDLDVETLSSMELSQVEEIEVEYVHREDLFAGAIESMVEHLDGVRGEIQDLLLSLEHREVFQKYCEGLGLVAATLSEFRQALESEGIIVEDSGLWSTAQTTLDFSLSALFAAMEIGDDELSIHLLQYDVVEALKEWQQLLRDGKRGMLSFGRQSADL